MFIFVLNHLYMLNALWLQATIFVHIINVIISITKIIIIQLVVTANGAIVCYNLKTSVINYYLYKMQLSVNTESVFVMFSTIVIALNNNSLLIMWLNFL